MDVRVEIDPMACQGYGLCLGVAPEAFDIPDGSPVAVVLAGAAAATDLAVLHEAARSCPAQAITVTVSLTATGGTGAGAG